MCIDYKALNKITLKNKYPLPRIDGLLDQLRQEKYFTTLELRFGYHQVRVEEEDTWKIAFKTRQVLYEWLVIPFGLCGGELKINHPKMEAIMKWSVPTNVFEVKSFFGETQYLRKFIASFPAVAALLHAITASGKSFQWGKGQKKAFEELKKKIIQAPVLALADLKQPFEVETDESGYDMGAVLM
eukprot:PITA_29790